MFELRWLDRGVGVDKILQYRENKIMPCYSMVDAQGDFVKIPTWTEWKDVPVVKDDGKKSV